MMSLVAFWLARLVTMQWQLGQAQRGLLPRFYEAGAEAVVLDCFSNYHSFESWWERVSRGFRPEFVEFVEEQRSKAA